MEKILKILLFLPILALSTKAEWVVKSYQEIKNERVIRQTYEQSCGASSLATLLNSNSYNQCLEKHNLF